MKSFQDLKINADELRKKKQYKEAIKIYSELWISNRDKCDMWFGWGYAFSLRHIKEYEKALKICREVYKMKPDFRYNNDVYAWCIYYTEIANDEITNESKYLKAAEGILKLSTQDEQFSPYTITVFKVLKYFNEKVMFPAEAILNWTSKLNPLILDNNPFIITTKEGKQKELAPNKEQYFMLRIKAFFENRNYNECIDLSKHALSFLTKFHYDNDIWFKRYIANSNYNLGKLDIALSQLKEILPNKKEWFIQKEIADIYFKKQDYKNSLKYAIASALNFGKYENKIHLFELLFEIFEALNKPVIAKKHIEFVCLIRKQNQWKLNDDFSKLLEKLNIDSENLPNYNKLKSDLQNEWDNLKYADRIENHGIIKTILPHGKAGFVLSDNNESFYFSVSNCKCNPNRISEGLKVSFYLEESFDKKKQQNSKVATNIKLIGG